MKIDKIDIAGILAIIVVVVLLGYFIFILAQQLTDPCYGIDYCIVTTKTVHFTSTTITKTVTQG